MAISNLVTQDTYSGDGTTVDFIATFDIYDVTQIEVYLDGVLQTVDVDYTVVSDTVTFDTAPIGGAVVLLKRSTPKTQEDDYSAQVIVTAVQLEAAMDKIVMMVQEIGGQSTRAVRINSTIDPDDFNPELPADLAANQVLVVNAAGDGVEGGPTVDDISGATASATAAAASASAAATSASSASTSASAASTSATNAAASATAAAASALAAATTVLSVVGTRASPVNVTASGISFTSVTANTVMFVQGSGGAVTVTANPRIQAGTVLGQKLALIGQSDTNVLTMEDGNGLATQNMTLDLSADSIYEFIWDGTNWVLIQ